MFRKLKSFYFSLCFIIIIENTKNYIIIPFKSTIQKYNITYDNSSDFTSKFTKEMNKNKLYAKIPLGEPKKDAIFFFTMNDYFGLLMNTCPKGMQSLYDPYKSKTFTYDPESTCTYYDLFKAKIGNDNFSFFNNQKMKESVIINSDILVDNQTYPRNDYELGTFCGKIGLIVRAYYPAFYVNFISYLKNRNIIHSYQWGIFFFGENKNYNIDKEIQNNYDGFYVAGLTENDYKNIFNNNIVYNTYIENPIYTMIGGKFDKIYFKYLNNIINCSEVTNFEIDIEKNYIACPKDYWENIKKYYFKEHFANDKCKEIVSLDKYNKGDSMIICNLTIKEELKNFPKLYLFYRELNSNFTLDYKDLFIEINNKIYFLVIQPQGINLVWNLGKILVKKYSFMFDQDKKQIYCIHSSKYESDSDNEDITDEIKKDRKNDIKKDDKIYIYLSIVIIIIILAAVIGFIFGRKIWEKHRKRKAFELDENYDYSKENDNDYYSNIIN